MDVFVPIAIAASQVTSTTVAEPDTAQGEIGWVNGDWVVAGDLRVSTLSHRFHKVRADAAPGSKRFTGVTMRQASNSSPGLMTFTATHGLAVNDIVAFTVGMLTGAVVINQTYYVESVPSTTTAYIKASGGSVSIAPNGSGIATGLTFLSKFVQTVVDPLNAPTFVQDIWEDAGPTNRFKALDGFANTHTVKASSASWTIQLTGSQSINAIAVLNLLGAATVRVEFYDLSSVKTYDVTQNTAATTVPNWQNYFYFSTDSYDSAYFSGIPSTAGGRVVITFNGAGTISIGEIMLGYALSIGAALYGASGGITDYSVKDTNGFGGTYLNQRSYAKRLTTQLRLTKQETNRVARLLTNYRATAALWVLSPDPDYLGLGLIYGWYADFNIEIDYPSHNLCSLELKGLT